MDAVIDARIAAWLDDPAIDSSSKNEIRKLQATGNDKELIDRFHADLEFGTGGLRGILGAGLNRMNFYTVGAAAQGLAQYICKSAVASHPAVAIAYDCRRQSDAFARRVAEVMAGNNIASYLFPAPRPTPQLSFAIRQLACMAGVVITASHNPPEYNGLKAYWSDGAQVVPPQDKAIIAEVRSVGAFSNIRSKDFDAARQQGLIHILDSKIDEQFLAAVDASCLDPEVCRIAGKSYRVVYTALHGTGGTLIPQALRRRGFKRITEVNAQADLNGNFPTVKSPNPEEAAALTMAVESAKREYAELVIGTDPDADRVGIAVRRHDGEYELLTGNQTAALLTWYICDQLTQQHRFPKKGVVLTTLVTGNLMKVVAKSYGATVEETLTGFKWIAERIRIYEQGINTGKTFLFGAEESYGYMPAAYVRDKDAVTSAAMITEMAAVLQTRGRTMLDQLETLYRCYGYHQEGALSVTLPGADGTRRIAAMMHKLRNSPPMRIGTSAVHRIGDLLSGVQLDVQTGEKQRAYELPSSDVLEFVLTDGTQVFARPSGTEPKIKFYILTRRENVDLQTARREATAVIDAVTADLKKITNEV